MPAQPPWQLRLLALLCGRPSPRASSCPSVAAPGPGWGPWGGGREPAWRGSFSASASWSARAAGCSGHGAFSFDVEEGTAASGPSQMRDRVSTVTRSFVDLRGVCSRNVSFGAGVVELRSVSSLHEVIFFPWACMSEEMGWVGLCRERGGL